MLFCLNVLVLFEIGEEELGKVLEDVLVALVLIHDSLLDVLPLVGQFLTEFVAPVLVLLLPLLQVFFYGDVVFCVVHGGFDGQI